MARASWYLDVMEAWWRGGARLMRRPSRLVLLLAALLSCADRPTTSLALPSLDGARAVVVAATDGNTLPEAVAFDVDGATPTLPTLRGAELAEGLFTVLLYDRPLDALELEPGALAVRVTGDDVDPFPSPVRAFERAASGDDDWQPKATLEQTALRPSRVGLARPCKTLEATWTRIEGGTGYVQAWTWIDPQTLVAATNTGQLYSFNTTLLRVTRLPSPGPLITALHTSRDGRVFAGTASTTLVMGFELIEDTPRLIPLEGARVPPEDAVGALAGPPPASPDTPEILYGLSRAGLLVRVPLAAPRIEAPELISLGEGSAGAGLVWLAPDRYVGYTNRALGRLIDIERDVARPRGLSLGAFSTIVRHPTLGAVLVGGLQPWLIAPSTGEARALAKLPAALVDVEAVAPVTDGLLFGGRGGLAALYLAQRDQVCAPSPLAETTISQLVPLVGRRVDSEVLAFAEAEPARDLPLAFGLVRIR